VGTTTVAVNLGLGLMQHGRACIVDLNSLAGQVAVQLRLSPDVTWHDIVDLPPSADKRRIGAIILRGHSSGVAVIAAPPRPVQERLSSLTLSYVFGVLAEAFRRIAVDLPDSLNAMSVTTLRHAAHIVLVVGDDPAGLATAPAALAALQDLGLTGTQHLVLNRSRPHGVSSQDVMQALRRPLAAELPYEPGQIAALNQGVPLVMSQPRSLYAQVILQLARAL
jgi:MinD-like ATPase involved in chromosome partitioning or flagellar assembly